MRKSYSDPDWEDTEHHKLPRRREDAEQTENYNCAFFDFLTAQLRA